MGDEGNKNYSLWNKVCTSKSKYLKSVKKGAYEFTAIQAQSQIMDATGLWGPMGLNWGIHDVKEMPSPEWSVTYLITLFYKDPNNPESIGYVKHIGSAQWEMDTRSGVKKVSDAPKMALTDGITKCLSQLGFNADVYLNLWDDNKYVREVKDNEKKEYINQAAHDLEKMQKDVYKMARSKRLSLEKQAEIEEHLKNMTKTEENWLAVHERLEKLIEQSKKEMENAA